MALYVVFIQLLITRLYKRHKYFLLDELRECIFRRVSGAYLVEDLDERVVMLAINMFELDGDIVHLLQRFGAKEIGCVVVWSQ